MSMTKHQWARSILVISPHGDDEVIGCGGMIARASDNGAKVTVVVMATGGIKHRHLREESSYEERLLEFEACSQILGVCSRKVLFPGMDMNLEKIPMIKLVSALDHIQDEGEFEEIYIPQPSHNQDHRITYEAALSSMRPGCRRRTPVLVATYEGTSSGWRPQESVTSGLLYIDISSLMERKMLALDAYKSQLRTFPHPTSKEAVYRLSSMRGMECGVSNAELFHILRLLR